MVYDWHLTVFMLPCKRVIYHDNPLWKQAVHLLGGWPLPLFQHRARQSRHVRRLHLYFVQRGGARGEKKAAPAKTGQGIQRLSIANTAKTWPVFNGSFLFCGIYSSQLSAFRCWKATAQMQAHQRRRSGNQGTLRSPNFYKVGKSCKNPPISMCLFCFRLVKILKIC